MNMKELNRMFARTMYGIFILALVFSVTGNVYAEEPIFLRAFPDQNAVDGGNWPLGATVHMAIDDPATENDPDYEDYATVVTTEEWWISTYVSFEFDGLYDLKRGDKVTLSTDGILRYLVVPELWVTGIDPATNIVSGKYEGVGAGTTVHVFIGGGAELYISTVSDGTWAADFDDVGFDLLPGMQGAVEVWFDEFNDSTTFNWLVPQVSWRDEFNGPFAQDWYWVNENEDKWTFNDGFLRIYTSPYGTGGENLLLRPLAGGDFAIETHLFFTPDTNFQIAGLVIWQDDQNFLQFGRAFCDPWCVGNAIYFDKILGGNGVDGNFGAQVNSANEAYLRLERRGEMVRAFFSYEGITWFEIGTHWIPPDFQVNGVGLTSSQDYSAMGIPADFDYFEMTEGWGFLPEGFHDYDGGDVPAWACNAGGWAVDPDNREADIAVEVNVDGTSYFANANEYREDLDNAGVCVDGKCGFSMSLWDTITSYEMHNITAYAQDIESGEWVRLYNSPKELTCRTYDIYAYDPLTGTTKQISNIRDADEYDPTWSPNGKFVAHDVVTSDSHKIYVTDVKTGVSTVLHGTEDGGNDAAWSPNGKWIAFDRRWFDNDQNIYIVPATGGERLLVAENAFTASWAPNGKRIAFQNPDGSIRTAPVDRGKDGETLIAEFGGLPAWSPDGNWIAYSKDGDIWKVQVNVQGKVLGEPIQLTSGPFQDGKPTWSPDSQTIIYDSGFGQDWDLWSVPAAGGMPTWLTGAPVFGEYGPANARNSSNVAYASFSPNGQAERTWVAAFTYDAGTWDEGSHTYQFWTEGAPAGEERSLNVSIDNPLYPGLVLIRPGTIRAETPDGCANIEVLHPDQQTRFHVGWTFDGVYADARMYLENLNAQVRWDSWEPVDMLMHEIFPLTPPVDWFGYTCTYTVP